MTNAPDPSLPMRFTVLNPDEVKPHEEVNDDAVVKLQRRLETDGVLRDPVVVDEATGVILDGHHRFAALRGLNCSRIPVYLVDYRDERIQVEAWRDEDAPTKDEIITRARRGDLYPPKTTRHESVRHLPPHPTAIDELRDRP